MFDFSMKKTALFALCAVLLSSSVLTSCEKAEKDDGKPDSSGEVVLSKEEKDGFELPDGSCEGKTFSLYIAMPTTKSSYIAEEETGELLNDSVYERNALVEEKTGVELDFTCTSLSSSGTDSATEATQIRTLIQAGDDTYDAFVHSQSGLMPSLIQDGLFVDWNSIPYVQMDKPWWYGNVVRDISFGTKVFAMTGDYNLASFSNTACIIFNKTMCDELGLEYPYSHVFDGTWTHDVFLDYIKAATKDLNGDGAMDYDNDRYGFAGWEYEQIPSLFCGYGGVTVVKDEYGLPFADIGNTRNYTVIDRMLEIFDEEGVFYHGTTYGIEDTMFNEGRLLFNDSFLSMVPGTRGLENIDVGFVPYPKMDIEQEEYYSRTGSVSALTYIPLTNTDLETTGATLEALAYYSHDTVLPAYFDIILTVKSTRDVESEEMIPIIKSSSRFLDQYIAFTGKDIVKAGKGNTLASYVATMSDVWETKMEALAELYTD